MLTMLIFGAGGSRPACSGSLRKHALQCNVVRPLGERRLATQIWQRKGRSSVAAKSSAEKWRTAPHS
jgi:hypothetical protein